MGGEKIRLNTSPDMGQVLSGGLSRALTEILCNAFDEDPEATNVTINQNSMRITNTCSRPFDAKGYFMYKPQDKRDSTEVTGKFGVGLKDAIALFHHHNCDYEISTSSGKYTLLRELEDRSIMILHDPTSSTNEGQVCQIVTSQSESREEQKEFEDTCRKSLRNCWHWLKRNGYFNVIHSSRKGEVAMWKKDKQPVFQDSNSLFVHGMMYELPKAKPFLVYNLKSPKSAIKCRDRVSPPDGWSDDAESLFVGIKDGAMIEDLNEVIRNDEYWEAGRDKITQHIALRIKAHTDSQREKYKEGQSLKRKIAEIQSEIKDIEDGEDEFLELPTKKNELAELEAKSSSYPSKEPRSMVLVEDPSDSLQRMKGSPICVKKPKHPAASVSKRLRDIPTADQILRGASTAIQYQLQKALDNLVSLVNATCCIDYSHGGKELVRFDDHQNCLFVSVRDSLSDETLVTTIERCLLHLQEAHKEFKISYTLARILLKPDLIAQPIKRPLFKSRPAAFCPLLIIDDWGTSTGGIAAFNMQLARELSKLENTLVYVYLTEAAGESRPCEEGICFIAADSSGFPITLGCTSQITTLIGHAHITGKLAVSLGARDEFSHCAKWLFMHTCPENVDQAKGNANKGALKDQELIDIADNCDMVWSVGRGIYQYWKGKIRHEDDKHILYNPRINPDFERKLSKQIKGPNSTEMIFLCFGRTEGVMHSKGIDTLPVVYNHLKQHCRDVLNRTRKTQLSIKFVLRGVKDIQATREILGVNDDPGFVLREYTDKIGIRRDLREASFVLMPSIAEPFGLVGLEALAAGCIPFVGRDSGLAYMINDYASSEDYQNLTVETDYSTFEDRENKWFEHISKFLEQVEKDFNTNELIERVTKALNKAPSSVQKMKSFY